MLTKSVASKPGSEATEERIVLEKFLIGVRDVKVKHYINKRGPSSINDAVRLGRECEEIRDWVNQSSVGDESSACLMDDLKNKVATLKNEMIKLRSERTSVHPTRTAADDTTVQPRIEPKEPQTSQGALLNCDKNVPAPVRNETLMAHMQRATQAALSSPKKEVMTGSSDLFSSSDSEAPQPVRSPRPVKRKRSVESRRRRRRAHAMSCATRSSRNGSSTSEEHSDDDNKVGAATEVDLQQTQGAYSETTRQVMQTVTKNYETGDSYYVWGEVHRDVPSALFIIDTGAMVSLLNKNVYDEIPEEVRPPCVTLTLN